ncbi:MAG: adenylate/guanylate cyclase domain-containing protein [Armatimonadota bacterium]
MVGDKVLRTVVLSDAVGFTARMQADEPAALMALANDHTVFRAAVESHDGVVVKSTGDGLLCLFESPAQAVRACLAAIPMMSELEHRYAVHTGEVTVTDEDVFGDAVNICARLEREAKAGTIVCSRMVFDLVRAQALPAAKKVGRVVVRGVQEPLEIYSWGSQMRKRRAVPWAATRIALVLAPLIVVGLIWQNRQMAEPADEQAVRRSVTKMMQKDGANSEAPDIEAFIDETYAQVLDEVEQYETVKAEAKKSVSPAKVVEWLKSSPMGKRERGLREIEHWSLAAMAVKLANSKDPRVVVEKLSASKDASAEIALKAFREEFAPLGVR